MSDEEDEFSDEDEFFEEEEQGEAEEEQGEAEEEQGEAEEESLPPYPEEEKELLFMIEFLVGTLQLKPGALVNQRLDPCILQGQHCIVLTFLHFPPMSICEQDVDSEKNVGGEETIFNSGKSLVFALTESQFESPPPVFLELTAFKEMPHGFPMPKIQLGKTKIDLTELFGMVFDKYDGNPDELPVAKSIKDNYTISADGVLTGGIDIYMRLTCFGQNIVTEFQKSDSICQPFLFKNLESEKIYECRETNANSAPAQPMGRTCKLSVPRELDPDEENYEEIFAEINGSALKVTVEKSKRREKPKEYRLEDFCDCDFPLPPALVEGVSELSVTPAITGEQEIPDGGIGKCNNKIVFQVPPSEQLAQPDGREAVSYKVNTCNEGEKHGHKGKNAYRILTGDSVNRPSFPNDPEKDVFILKIIKRGKSCKGKNTLELEFRMPKEKIEPPPKPPYMIDMAVGPDKQKKKKDKKKK